MKRSPIPKSALLAGLALAGVTWAAPAIPVAAAPASKVPQIAFEQYTLPNGLRVILSPDTDKNAAPVVSVVVTYDVGSRSEVADRSGFAHLFEHMMFQGSAHVAKTEHILQIESNGGTMNGTTNQDRTNFFETLPANQLELGLFLEADRMQSLDISQANLDNQRQVVEEEKRQSYDNRPYGGVQEALLDEAYSSFPYKHTTIGSMANLDAATLDDVRNFHKIYYEPNNAVLTVTGRFSTGDAKKLITRYFGPIAKAATPPPTVFTEPTTYPGERRKTLQDPLARQVRYTAGYVAVPGNDSDFYALDLLGDILSSGKTSRLYQALVEKNLAISAGAGMDENIGPGLFEFDMALPNGVDVAQAEPILDAEIARVQTDGVTEEELATAKAQERVDSIQALQTSMGRAQRLGLYAVAFKDPNRVNTLLPKLQAVTAADVQRVAKKYLVKENRSVVISVPAASAAQGGAQ